MKIQLDSKGEWEELPKGSKEGVYIDGKLFQVVLNIFYILSKDWDCVFQIDGLEGSGKSILGIFLGWILSKGRLGIKNIAENSDDAINKLETLEKGSVLIIDEGGLSFSSKEVMKKEQRKLVGILNVIRQKQMILIIIAPSFFELNKYISIHRSKFLLHVYTDKRMERGRFAYFSTKQKKMLYEIGKKNFNSYSKPRSKFVGRFIDWKPFFYKEYLKTKEKSLIAALKGDGKGKGINPLDIYAEIVQKIRENSPELTMKVIAKALGVSERTILRYTQRKVPKEGLN